MSVIDLQEIFNVNNQHWHKLPPKTKYTIVHGDTIHYLTPTEIKNVFLYQQTKGRYEVITEYRYFTLDDIEELKKG